MSISWKYIAGFFDGEGSICHNGKGFRITVSQSSYGVLKDIKVFVGLGNIFETKKRQEHWKDSWVYYIAKQEDVYTFLMRILPFLIVKKKLALKTLPELKRNVEQIKKRKNRTKKNIIQAKKLRKQGLSYRKIGKKMNIDFGHARRLTLK